jgi:hypothetical protein
MNYDDHKDFNKARTAEEATPEFAKARAAVYDRANADFAGGSQDGLWYLTIGGLMALLLIIATS